MSLINKMLQDLDERRATALERDGISRHVRTLPPTRELPWKGFVLSFVGALAGAAVVWFALKWHADAGPPAVPAAAVNPPATKEVSPAPDYPPLAELTVKPPPELPQKVVQRPISRPDAAEPALKLDRVLAVPKAVERAPGPSNANDGNPTANEPAAAPSSIEKQPHGLVATDSAEGAYRKGMGLAKRGLSAEAAAAFRTALQADPKHVSARQALLSLLVDQQQWEEAQALGTDGLALDPKQVGWAMLVARLQVERGDVPSALNTLETHARYAASNADYLSFQAVLLQKAGRNAEAMEHYRAALAIRPGEGRWWYGLGLALEAAQRMVEAKDAFLQARAAGNLPAEMAAAVEQKLKGS